MKRLLMWLGVFALFGIFAGTASADPPIAHQAITSYDGPQTCAMCHPMAAQQVAKSVHYQQKALGDPARIPSMAGKPVGMLGGY